MFFAKNHLIIGKWCAFASASKCEAYIKGGSIKLCAFSFRAPFLSHKQGHNSTLNENIIQQLIEYFSHTSGNKKVSFKNFLQVRLQGCKFSSRYTSVYVNATFTIFVYYVQYAIDVSMKFNYNCYQ